MRWNRLFADLEDQMASESATERAMLESENERLRVAGLSLRDRLIAVGTGTAVGIETADGAVRNVSLMSVGADVVCFRTDGSSRARILAPLESIVAVTLTEHDLLRSAAAHERAPRSPLEDRVTLGFLLRDAARRRRAVRVALRSGAEHSGTIDRAGRDHLDLALHEPGVPRRVSEVRGYRMIAFSALAWVWVDGLADRDPS